MIPNPTRLPDGHEAYRRTPTFTATTVPAALTADHSTKAGVWGIIHVETGTLIFRSTDPRRPALETVLTPNEVPGLIEPTIAHHVELIGDASFHVEFYRPVASAARN
jgi:tellurite resistance-related uncharacterized protein